MKRLKQLPFVSAFLVLANVIIYIICLLTGGEFYNQGILDLVDVLYRKEYGRVLSALFFHADIGHLFNNMLILFFLGAMLEREIGHIALAVLYFLSGTALSLYSGFTGGNIDNAAHVGGLITGFLAGSVWCALQKRKEFIKNEH